MESTKTSTCIQTNICVHCLHSVKLITTFNERETMRLQCSKLGITCFEHTVSCEAFQPEVVEPHSNS